MEIQILTLLKKYFYKMFKISPTLFQKKSNLENENYSISSEEKIIKRKKLKNPKFLILSEEEKLIKIGQDMYNIQEMKDIDLLQKKKKMKI